ncbi:MAG: hypothetical protein ACOC32_01020 [Nanoarchaeota archaeon]
MGLDEEDTPVGGIIALVLVTIIVLIVIMITFDSCSEYEYGEIYRFCGDAEVEINPVLGEQKPCFDEEGNAVFSVLNTGTLPIEGFIIDYKDMSINKTLFVPVLAQEVIKVDLDLRIGQLFDYFNVTPVVFNEEMNKSLVCTRTTRKISSLERCGVENN